MLPKLLCTLIFIGAISFAYGCAPSFTGTGQAAESKKAIWPVSEEKEVKTLEVLEPRCDRYKELNGMCTREYLPICASDLRTYSTECVFCVHLFKNVQGRDRKILHEGSCTDEEAAKAENIVAIK